MATATKKVRASASPVNAATRSEPGSLAFRTYRDNGGDYHWEIAGGDGEVLAHSVSLASQDDAERAARKVCEGAGSARLEPYVVEEHQTMGA